MNSGRLSNGHLPYCKNEGKERGASATCYHRAMKTLVDIDLLDDEALQGQMAMDSLWIVLAGVALGIIAAIGLPRETVTPWWFAQLGAVSLLALPVHELVHAAAFKLLSKGTARLAFGFSNWMLYTTAAGTRLPRKAFCVVLLAPAVVVTSALGVGAWLLGRPLLGWFLAVVHLAGCTGDMGYVRVIVSEPEAAIVEDTERGITLYAKE